jgi:hypothetical protein
MDTLIQILQELKGISGPAMWVGVVTIILLFAYKIALVGSVYGVIKFGIQKVHDVMVKPRHELVERRVDVKAELNGITIGDEVDYLIAQITRIKGRHIGGGAGIYIHHSDIDWLRKAIDERADKDLKEKQ